MYYQLPPALTTDFSLSYRPNLNHRRALPSKDRIRRISIIKHFTITQLPSTSYIPCSTILRSRSAHYLLLLLQTSPLLLFRPTTDNILRQGVLEEYRRSVRSGQGWIREVFTCSILGWIKDDAPSACTVFPVIDIQGRGVCAQADVGTRV